MRRQARRELLSFMGRWCDASIAGGGLHALHRRFLRRVTERPPDVTNANGPPLRPTVVTAREFFAVMLEHGLRDQVLIIPPSRSLQVLVPLPRPPGAHARAWAA